MYSVRKIFLSAVLLCMSVAVQSTAQEQLHRTGLIMEDLRKSAVFQEYKPMGKIGSLPSSIDLSGYMPAVGNQGVQGACVAFSFGYYSKTYQELRERGWDKARLDHIFSPAFIYNQINGGVDSGSSFSNAALLLASQGCATVADMPFDQYNFTNYPSEESAVNATNYRTSGAYFINTEIPSGVVQLKKLLYEGNVAVMGIYVWGNFDNIQSHNYVYAVADKSGKQRGGHAVTIIGYDDSLQTSDGPGAFKIINSWGQYWGKKGYGWISYKAVMNSELTQCMAAFVTDRIGYTPKLRAFVKVTHPSRARISLKVGTGQSTSPVNVKTFSFIVKSSVKPATPANNLVLDISDFYSSFTPGQPVNMFFECKDISTDGMSGRIDTFYVQDLVTGQTVAAAGTPRTMPDMGSRVLNITLTPGTIDRVPQLSSPINAGTDVSESPLLKWNSLSDGTRYHLQVAVNGDMTRPVYDVDNITQTSYQLSKLERNKIYFWRICESGTDKWSDIWSFRTTVLNSTDGYTVASGVYNWIDISRTGKEITDWENINSSGVVKTPATLDVVLDDGYAASAIPIGFPFEFYGHRFDSLYVGINGVVSFSEKMLNTAQQKGYTGSPNYIGAFNDEYFPYGSSVFNNSIAVAYADLSLYRGDGYGGGKILYENRDDKLILTWQNLGSFEALKDTNNTFQLILNKTSNTIQLQYKSISHKNTIAKLKSGLQQCDTLAMMWVSKGAPSSNLLTAEKAVVFSPAVWTGVSEKENHIVSFDLKQNYPNPFNPSTVIAYSLAMDSRVSLEVYNILGQHVRTLVDEMKPSGSYTVTFDASGLSSGIYVYMLKSGDSIISRKMTFVK